MNILASVVLFAPHHIVTATFQTREKDGKIYLLHQVSEEHFLAIQLHPEKILPPHIPQQDASSYQGVVGPSDHQAMIVKADHFD